MTKGFVGQMQDFALTMQKTLVEHVQTTMLRQLEVFEVMQKPMTKQIDQVTTSMQHIVEEQVQMLSSDRQSAMPDQAFDFTRRIQSIMAEQMQLFMTTTQNPTEQDVEEFIAGMQGVMLEQMKLAANLQELMAQQMRQFTEVIRQTMSDLTGEGKSEDSSFSGGK